MTRPKASSKDFFEAWCVRYEVMGVWSNFTKDAYFEYEAGAKNFAAEQCTKVSMPVHGQKRLIDVSEVLCVRHAGKVYAIGRPVQLDA